MLCHFRGYFKDIFIKMMIKINEVLDFLNVYF